MYGAVAVLGHGLLDAGVGAGVGGEGGGGSDATLRWLRSCGAYGRAVSSQRGVGTTCCDAEGARLRNRDTDRHPETRRIAPADDARSHVHTCAGRLADDTRVLTGERESVQRCAFEFALPARAI